jgi:hypothetical protein
MTSLVTEQRLARRHRDQHLRSVLIALVDARRQAGWQWSLRDAIAWRLAMRRAEGASLGAHV